MPRNDLNDLTVLIDVDFNHPGWAEVKKAVVYAQARGLYYCDLDPEFIHTETQREYPDISSGTWYYLIQLLASIQAHVHGSDLSMSRIVILGNAAVVLMLLPCIPDVLETYPHDLEPCPPRDWSGFTQIVAEIRVALEVPHE